MPFNIHSSLVPLKTTVLSKRLGSSNRANRLWNLILGTSINFPHWWDAERYVSEACSWSNMPDFSHDSQMFLEVKARWEDDGGVHFILNKKTFNCGLLVRKRKKWVIIKYFSDALSRARGGSWCLMHCQGTSCLHIVCSRYLVTRCNRYSLCQPGKCLYLFYWHNEE